MVRRRNFPVKGFQTVVVHNDREGSARTQLAVRVVAPNQDPSIAPIENQQMTAGETRELGVNASDPDGDTLSIVARSEERRVGKEGSNRADVRRLRANNIIDTARTGT